MNTMHSLSALTLLSILVACGSRGGGGNPPGGAMSITAANAEQVAVAALQATDGVVNDTSRGPILAATITDPEGFDLTSFLLENFRVALVHDQLLAAVTTTTVQCGNGRLEMIFNDRDDNRSFSSGDTYEFRFINCGDGVNNINGSMFYEAVVFDGSSRSNSYKVSLTIRFVNFTVVGPSTNYTYNGSITYTVTIENNTATYSYSVEGNFGGLLAGSSITRSTNRNGDELITSRGRFSYSGSSLSFDTVAPFATRRGGRNPYAGQCVINGSAGTELVIFVVDEQNVRIEIDADGDGTFETVINRTWSELQS